MPNQRVEIAAHRFEMPRVSLVALQCGAIPKANHHPKIKIPRQIRPDRPDRSPRLYSATRPESCAGNAPCVRSCRDPSPGADASATAKPPELRWVVAWVPSCRPRGKSPAKATAARAARAPSGSLFSQVSFPFSVHEFRANPRLSEHFRAHLTIENFLDTVPEQAAPKVA